MARTLEKNVCPPKLKDLVERTISKINVGITSFLGRNFGLSKPSCSISTLCEFIEGNNGNYYLIKSELKESYHGIICTILHIKDIIKIGGILLGFEERDIKEMLKTENINEDFTDKVTEFSEQFSAMIDCMFRNKLSKPVNVKFVSCSPLNKDNAKDVLKGILDDEYLNFSSLLLIKGFETGKCNIFFPIQTVDDFFGEMIHEKNTNVLVTDNSLEDLIIIKKYLINTPFRVLDSSNIKDSFYILQKENIHLIILDINLPEENGIEICKKIKKTPYTRGIPLIMSSSTPTYDDVIESLQSGARDFLVKPFTKEKLLNKINRFKIKNKPAKLF